MAKKNASGSFLDKAGGVFEKIGEGVFWIGDNTDLIWRYIKKFHKIILAIPVGIAAACLAVYSGNNLPEYVGINLQQSGEYAQMVSREIAVLGPLAVTALCLLLMFASRRTLYPWLISIFSLVLPLLLLLTNIFPM